MIKILLDITPLQTNSKKRGIGRVVFEFVSRLIEDENNNFNVYLLKFKGITQFDNYPRLIEVKSGFLSRFQLSYQIIKNRINIYHCSESFVPIIKPRSLKIITMIYDVIPFIFKNHMYKIPFEKINLIIKNKVSFYIIKLVNFFNNKLVNLIVIFIRYNFYKIKLYKTISKSDHFIFISNCTRNDFSKYLNKSLTINDKTIYLGFYSLVSDYNQSEKSLEFLNRYGLQSKKYFYYIGAYDYRKNILSMIEIFSIFKNEYKDLSKDYKLVLIGNIGELTKKQLADYADYKKIGGNVIFTGYLDDREVSCIIDHSKLFLFTSLYEGFGLPILEAMSHKIPVITFSNSCIPEICHDAALLIDDQNIKKFVSSIVRLISDNNFYNKMVQKGYKRHNFFSWDKTKDEIVQMYNEVSNKYFKKNNNEIYI